jgi:hypothetical protein
MEDATALSSAKKSVADEIISSVNPMITKNHTNLLRQILANDSAIWKGIRYLEESKKAIQDLTSKSNILLIEPPKDSSRSL